MSFFLAEQQGFEPWRHFHALRDFESRLFAQLEYCSIQPDYYTNNPVKNQPKAAITQKLIKVTTVSKEHTPEVITLSLSFLLRLGAR